jgi:hypothetical protein
LPSDLGDGDEAPGVAALVGMSLGRPVMSWLFGEISVQPA